MIAEGERFPNRDRLSRREVAMSKISAAVFGGALLASAPVSAGVTIGFDAASLNVLLPALATQEVTVPLPAAGSVNVALDDLRVLGFAPGAEGQHDEILTSVTLRVPALGLTLPLEPRMVLAVVEDGGQSVLELRFSRVSVPLALGAAVDASPFLAPLRFRANDVIHIAGAQGDIPVRTRLVGIEMDAESVRFEYDLEVATERAR
jgi:hypothetical protein